MNFKLITPRLAYKDSYLLGCRELKATGLPWYQHDYDMVEANFETHLQKILEGPKTRTEDIVPWTELWGIVDEEYAGRISIRHELNDSLRIFGGNIGYDTVPRFRGRGVAFRMLEAALPVARTNGLTEVLLTCDDTNIASIRIIEKNGGILSEKKVYKEGAPLKRYYWIKL